MKILNDIKYYLVIYSVILSLVSLAFWNYGKKLKQENQAYKNDVSVLMDSIKTYVVLDSMNAAQVGELQLKLSEYKKYRQEDMAIINKLKSDKPTTITKTQTVTEQVIVTQVKDSIVYQDTVKAINYTSHWTDLHGYLSKDTLQVKITNREELILVESKQRKKFLGIKLPGWLFGYKTNTVDVVSKNPNTTIMDIEFVKIR